MQRTRRVQTGESGGKAFPLVRGQYPAREARRAAAALDAFNAEAGGPAQVSGAVN
ncbi:MAG: hypothetical protein M3430_02610 [Acidobacteriota bacterium]|nr:hypothetical protein [Acidobacteriota bacterium]